MDLAYPLRSALTENLNLKLISALFALILYSVVHGSQDAQRSVRLNVVALLPQTPDRVLMTNLPEKITVTVRGPKSSLDELNADDLPVQLDLRGGNETRFTFEPSIIPLPPGLKVEQIDPPAIDLAWEEVIASDRPVQVGVVGTPAPGYVVKGAPVADPSQVRMHGPKSRLAVVQFARADAFDVTGLTAGKYTRELAIDRPPNRIELDNVASITATVEIGREVAERPFTRVPIAVLGHTNAKAQPAEIDVRLSCPAEIVRALRPEQLVPRVQVTSGADHGSDVLPVQLSIDQCDVHLTPQNVVVRW